jgi:non-specific serine/threonine protein kinase/serine/threonine-protein kinase
MTTPGWDLVEELFHKALEQPTAVRDAWLAEQRADAAVVEEVRSLLDSLRKQDELPMTTPESPSPEQPVPLPAESFGSYRAIRLIGHGGMGAVYLAERADGRFERSAAVKVIAAHLAGDDFLRRLQTEGRLLAALDHPNINRLLDVGVSGSGQPFLVLEFVEGERIDRYADSRKLGIRERLGLFLQICEAVDYAHRNLILHCDLKPGNILVARDGVVKLLDFGTASLMATEDASVTVPRALTPRYASPEQLRGERLTTASDGFALGMMLYELLTGAMPFRTSASLIAVVERAMEETEPTNPLIAVTEQGAAARAMSVGQLRFALRGDLSSIMTKALAHDPKRRYASVRQLADEIGAFLEGRPVTARPQTAFYRAGKFVRRHWIPATLGTAGVLLASALGVMLILQYGRAQRQLGQMRNLSQSYLTDVYHEVSALPGSTHARMLIVDRARRNLDGLYAEAPADPEMRDSLANAYIELAGIQGEPFMISLGDSTAALASYRRAESLAAQSGDRSWESIALLVRAREGIAGIQVRAGEYLAAAKTLRSVRDPARSLVEKGPRNLNVVTQPVAEVYLRCELLLGHALLRAADVDRSVEGVQQALRQLEHTVTVAEEIGRRRPEMPDLAGRYSQYVGYAWQLLGDFTGDTRDYARSLQAHRRAAAAGAEEYRKQPTPQNRRNYADALCYFGWSQVLSRQYQDAVRTLQEAATNRAAVAEGDPNSRESQLDLATVYFRLGAAEVRAGAVKNGLAHLARARSMTELPRPVRPVDRETVVLYAGIREEIAGAMMGRGDAVGALRALAEAVAAVKDGQSVPGWRVRELEQKLDDAMRRTKTPGLAPGDSAGSSRIQRMERAQKR